MNILRSYYLCAGLALALASCGTQKMVSTPVENIDKMPMKTGKIAENDLKRWSDLDLAKDTIPGMSVDKAYAELLKGKKSTKVIVAVVDSGIDIDHEDLKPAIWTNPKEIAGNAKDDDNNGYIDDIHGWNFLGDAEHENMEYVRIVKKGDDGSATYRKAKAELEKEMKEAMQEKMQVDFIMAGDKAIADHLKKKDYTLDDVKKIETTDQTLLQYKGMMIQVLGQIGSKEDFDKEIEEFKDHVYGQVNYHLNLQFDGRKAVGDNPEDLNNKKYGNNNVIGPEKKGAKHGTHVAGIIAQTRGNNKGGDGVASNNVQIMAVRAVPDGDEYDKDIALGIRYAVDNGAKVINGSFGKYYSTHPEWVHDAIKYAASKDVLVVFAAGNESYDLDTMNKYPTDSYNNQPEITNNVLIIGATAPTYGTEMVAVFSNYGKTSVDIFAPGDKIYATTPSNTYQYLQGTSMASPNVAGVAALIRSYYPSLTAAQVKQIIMDSGTTLTNKVNVGEGRDVKPFNEVSKSGKIVNAYNALLMASKMAKK
ncbi:S8 subtilisin family serine endopeptidase precursor [Flavobacterium enshiense DK69]|uniref:Peptidase S8 n=1 Tax=Flavobacterium enshiense DK69 TaxID=1107311 RepID=V6SDF9_9FLAO|nr:S8 family peptidase [Flavobacterium enshiense]ESU24621.1 S8 subtilisin family serine endopeptidase precursor [Flavobacterium enshiense DK69]KGO95510.1 peptidase S8 [Flavobacterium enshiense DK69]